MERNPPYLWRYQLRSSQNLALKHYLPNQGKRPATVVPT